MRMASPPIVSLLVAVLTIGIFALDLATPLGWADGFLYLIPLLLIFRLPARHYLAGFAALCSGLIIAGWLFSPAGGTAGQVIYNRFISIAVLWMTALFLRYHKQVEEMLHHAQETLETRVEERTAEFRQVIELLKSEITERKQAEEALQESEQRMCAILAGALDAVVGMDIQGLVTFWNPRSETIFGWTRSEAVGRKMSDMIIPPQHREAHELGLQHFLATGSGSVLNRRIEIAALRRDGTEFPVELTISASKSDDSYQFTAFIADITERKQAETALRESEQRLNQLLNDRERISRDLHDNIIQMLYAIGLGLEESQRLFGEDSKPASSNLSNAIKELNAVIRDVRSYITWSEPKVSDGRQFKTAIERLARTMEGAHLLHFCLKVDQKTADRLTSDEASHVLYIAREAMSNALRHSQARNVVVLFQAHDGHIQLQVKDDGIGFDAPITELHGQGLLNIAARAKELGAKLQIASQPGHGSSIVLDIPKEGNHVSV